MVRVSRFPLAQFGIIFGGLLLASGLHAGLLLLTARLDIGDMITVHVVLAYWVAVSLGLAFLTRHLMKKTYEEPLQNWPLLPARWRGAIFRSTFRPFIRRISTITWML